MSPTDKILNYITKHPVGKKNGISGMEALGLWRVSSLRDSIYKLRKKGHKIKSVRKNDPTGKPYMRYLYVSN